MSYLQYQLDAEESVQTQREEKKTSCPHCPLKKGESIYENEAGGQRLYKSFWHDVDGKWIECVYGPDYWEEIIRQWGAAHPPQGSQK